MKLKTATLIAIIGLILNLLYIIGNVVVTARAHGISPQWLVSPVLLHGSLLIFFVVLYRRQNDGKE